MSIPQVENKFKDSNYGEFKKAVADQVCDLLERIQKRYNELVGSSEVEKILTNGANEVRELAKDKFNKMKNSIGLYR